MKEQIKYKIASMRVLQSDIKSDCYNRSGSIQLNNEFSFAVNVEKNLLRCCHRLTLKQEGKNFAEFVLETIFSVDSFEDLIDGAKLNIPTYFLVQCGSISYGSLRGIVLREANDIGLENMIIPPLYIDTIIKEPMVVDVTK